MTLNRRWLVILLLLLYSAVAHARDTYFDGHRNDILSAVWKPDGAQFATWHTVGYDVYVDIWRVSDGLRLMVLDHGLARGILAYPNAHISEVYWSDDGETITTVIHTRNEDGHVRRQLWSAETGDMLYSYVDFIARSHWLGPETHQILNDGKLVAYWTDHRLAYMDIELGSATLGQELAAIDFGALTADPFAYWSGDRKQALFILHDWGARCPSCFRYYRLIDTDPTADSFGETLWELQVSRSARGDSWYSANNLFALHRDGKIEAWDLNRNSLRFGRKILRVEREFEFFHTLLFDDSRNRIIIVEQSNMALIEGAHPDAGPQCIDRRCEYHIGFWDIDMTSPTTNTRLMSLVHAYPYNGRGSRVVLSETSSQIHVHTVEKIDKGDESVWLRDVFAYDLASGAPAEARDIARDPAYQPAVYPEPLADLSHLEDESTRYRAIALSPDGAKLLARRFDGEDMMDATVTTVLIYPRTGVQLLPPRPAG